MSDELKSLKDLNPAKQTTTEEPQTVPETSEDYETPATEFDAGEEEYVEAETETASAPQKEEEALEYISPDEDTSLGTQGIFDFGKSINRRRKLVTEKLEVLKAEEEDRQLEEEIEADSDSEDGENFGFNDEDFTDETEEEIIETVPVVPVKNKIAEAAAPKEPIKTEPVRLASPQELPKQSDLFLDNEDFDDIDDIDDDAKQDDQFQEKQLEDLKSEIAKKLRPVEQSFDMKAFTIAKTPISVNAALEYDESVVRTFDWPLMSAGKLVSMKPFSGTEIDVLNSGNSRTRINNLKDIYRELYNHISDADKTDFEAWLKITSFMDIPHLYMAAYVSSFYGANYIPYTCIDAKCNHIFLSDDIEIRENMVKYKDDAAKLKFNEIMDNGSVASNKLYETRVIQVSDRYAIGFREPSIFNTIFENAVLDQKFIEKYQKLLSVMVYIDTIYLIKDGQLYPIALKVDRNNLAKTTKYKISTYAKIIAKLPSDGYQRIISIISAINELGDEVTYQLPEVTCPKCSSLIPAEAKESTELLFSRHQLALIANS